MSIHNSILKYLLLLLMIITMTSCGGSSSSGGCDLIANPDSSTNFRVENNLSSGLEWYFESGFAFGSDMKPGECNIMGVSPRQYTVAFQQCNIGDAACTSNFGSIKMVVFTVAEGETFTITVDSKFF